MRQTERPGCRPQRQGARTIALHARAQRAPATQRVIDEIADCRSVARASKAMAFAPVGERGRSGAMPLEHFLEDLDGGLDVRTRPHGRQANLPVSTCVNSFSHMPTRTKKPNVKAGVRQTTLLGPI